MPAAITVRNVGKIFGTTPRDRVVALHDVTCEVAQGEFFVILGPSGCGKSTLLRIMSGLDIATHGTVTYGAGLSRADIGFVFQQFALLPWLTVTENIALGLIGRGVPVSVRQQRVERELQRFHLDRFAGSYPHELSVGMQQRVGIARALATDPKIIFLDEPFSELDSFTAEELRADLLAIWEAQRPTIIMVSHKVPETLELADRIAVITARPGTIEAILPNELPRPRAKRAPAFFALEDRLYALVKP